MLDMSKVFVQQLLESIPFEQRGNSADMLVQFIHNAERVSGLKRTLEEKEDVLLELQQLIASIKDELVKQEPEDLIIRRGLMGMFELLARMSIEERRFNEKFIKASDILEDKLLRDPHARDVHHNLLQILAELEKEDNIVEREQLFKQFRQIRQLEYGL